MIAKTFTTQASGRTRARRSLHFSVWWLPLALACCAPDPAPAPALSSIGSVREIPSPAPPASGQPQLTLAPDGRVVLSWMEPVVNTTTHAFRYALGNGSGWSSPATVAERDGFFVNWADVPSVFPFGRDRLVAHWLQYSGRGADAYGVRIAVSDAHARLWGTDLTPHRDAGTAEHGFASFFQAADGGVGVVWLDGREMVSAGGDGHEGHAMGAMTLRATHIAADGTAGEDIRLDARVCECCPTAAVATRRGAVVAYRDRSDREVRDIAVMRLENGTWQGPTLVHADNWQINACPVNGPALAADADRVALAWFTAEGDTPRALLAFSGDGGTTFGAPIRVDDARSLGRVAVEMLDDGSAVVMWMEFLETGSELRARVVQPDGRRGPSATITTTPEDRQSGYARMVRSGSDLFFAWTATEPQRQVATAVASLRP